jgi:periplasmic copper chaperone A
MVTSDDCNAPDGGLVMVLNARFAAATVTGASLMLAATGAHAHISIPEVGNAGKNQVITFNVGHGCSGADTYSIEVQIPKEVTTVLGVPNFFGPADVKTDDTGAVTSVVWTKQQVRPKDDQFYQLQLRIAVPDLPFETLNFPTIQRCRTQAGEERVSEWVNTETPTPMDAEPSPKLLILPARKPGWNKFTTPKAITDLSIFADAQIVWVGDSAYSSNEATAALIAGEDGVSELEEIEADAEIWVKY